MATFKDFTSTRNSKRDSSTGLTFALQALLMRHEAYMSEAEKTRSEMSSRIQELENDKKDLEENNKSTIEENRGLLNQLEDLNNTIASSENHVKSLEATLQSTQQELRRLEGLASRTHELELQLTTLEQEQQTLQQTVKQTEEDERSALQRWKNAERNLMEVQDQLERIEREAREERERHVEVVGRMERQQQVEKELSTAAGRLKGAAAASAHQQQSGSNVVSHFVKDILQDNANLQLGIVELREMLESSNNEVQSLREQMMLHQRVVEEDETGSGPPTLRAELAPKEPQIINQELHIHHHYHVPVKKETPRLKKKRHSINPSLFTPPNGKIRPSSASTAAAILSQTSVSIPSPTPANHRWSTQSGQTGVSDYTLSSAPSSPRSNYRSSALFDRSYPDTATDSSRPTSPSSSVDPTSPTFSPYHRKQDSNFSFKQPGFKLTNIIHEEREDATDIEDLPSLQLSQDESSPSHIEESVVIEESSALPADIEYFNPSAHFAPTLRRSTSHESILSISGIDIHTLKSRPSQMTITHQKNPLLFNPRSRPSLSNLTASYVSSSPISSTSTSTVTAQPSLTRGGHDSRSYLKSSMGIADQGAQYGSNRPPSINSMSSGDSGATATRKAAGGGGLGGWVWNRWGATPTSPVRNMIPPPPSSPSPARPQMPRLPGNRLGHRSVTTPAVPTTATRATEMERDMEALRAFMGGRPPGINQKGPVPGIWSGKAEKPKTRIIPERVDIQALAEVLME